MRDGLAGVSKRRFFRPAIARARRRPYPRRRQRRGHRNGRPQARRLPAPAGDYLGGCRCGGAALDLRRRRFLPDGYKVQAGTSTWDAIRIIIVADAVMSLDNVIALVGAARGDLLLLAIGITM